MLNVVALMGRLVRDPELRKSPSGVSVTTFTIAVDRSFVKQGEQRQADFIDIVCWRGTAEFVCKYFHKGSMVAVNGSIQTRTYQDKNGNNRKAFEIVADNVHFAGAKNQESQQETVPAAQTSIDGGKMYPSEKLSDYSTDRNAVAAPTNDGFTVIDDNEDLPF